MTDNPELAREYHKVRDAHGQYVRLPASLAASMGVVDAEDEFGIEARYEVIRAFLEARKSPGKAVDLGGNCGFFSLSLLADGVIEGCSIYDLNREVMDFGSKVAEAMGDSDRARFVTKSLSLETLNELPAADVILCQNIIHHAGSLFDQDIVKRRGWESYALEFLQVLRAKCKTGVFAMAFKKGKPSGWQVPNVGRDERFRNMLAESGWSLVTTYNVRSLADAGSNDCKADFASARPRFARLQSAAWHLGGRRGERIVRSLVEPTPRKLDQYYLYLCE